MDKQEKIDQINYNSKNTIISVLGIEITDLGENFISGKMPVDKRTKQPFGLLHGGASVVLAETLGSIGGLSAVDDINKTVVGIAINANHLKPVTNGWVFGTATSIQIGKRMQVWEIRITNENKELICISRLTLAVVIKK